MEQAILTSTLRTAISSLHKALRRRMTTVTAFSMTEMETIGLLMRNGSMMPTELAAATRVTTQSMSQILKKFEEQQVIRRTPSKQDKRKVSISLTATGKKLVEKTRYKRDEYLKEKIDTLLTDKEKDLLEKVIPVLQKLSSTT